MNQLETITIEEYLSRKGISFKKANGELVTKCVFCGKENHLYFSAATGQYDCKVCGQQGNIFTLTKYLGDDLREIIINNNKNHMINQDKNKASFDVSLVDKCHNEMPEEIKKYLNSRGITEEIIEKNKLGWGFFYGKNWITIPIKDFSGNYTHFKLRTNPLEKEDGAKYMFYPAGSSATLYGHEALKDSRKIIICEGEFDQMVLENNGVAAITSTAGAGTFKKEWPDYLQNCQEIYICFDIDKAGRDGAEKLANGLFATTKAQIHIISLPKELGESGDITDYFAKGYKAEDLFSLYSKQKFDGQINIANRQNDISNKLSRAMKLVKIVESMDVELFLDQYNDPYIAVGCNGSNVIRLYSEEFNEWIQGESCNRGDIFSTEALKNAKMVLSTKARQGGKRHYLYVRTAKDGEGNFWYDLGEKAIKINAEGWEIIDNPPIIFRRFNHQLPQVMPQKGGSFDGILEFVNVRNEEDRLLLQIFIVTCLIPDFSHPVLTLYGEYGSAKSTTFKLIKDLIDPSGIQTIGLIKDYKEFIQTISHHWITCFDNLSGLTNELSDQICRACTGEGLSKRMLYRDDSDIIYRFKHVICINGIANVINRGDLLSRSLLIEMARISPTDRKSENYINERFAELRAEILGGCLDILSKAIKFKPNSPTDSLPRMADFAIWGYAIAEAMGMSGKIFFDAYKNNIQKQNEEAIAASPIGISVLELINKESTGIIRKQPTEMLSELKLTGSSLGLETTFSKYWPKDARHLWGKLTEIAPDLKARGVEISRGRGDERYIEIKDAEKYEAHCKELLKCQEMLPILFEGKEQEN